MFWQIFFGNLIIIAIITVGFQVVYSLSRIPINKREKEWEEKEKKEEEAHNG